jgi:hypothetical protein
LLLVLNGAGYSAFPLLKHLSVKQSNCGPVQQGSLMPVMATCGRLVHIANVGMLVGATCGRQRQSENYGLG